MAFRDLGAQVLEEFVEAGASTPAQGRAPAGKFSRVQLVDPRAPKRRRKNRPSQANPALPPRGTLCEGHCKLPLSDYARGRGFKICRDCRFQLGLVPTPSTPGIPRNLAPRPRNLDLAGKPCPQGCGRTLKSTSKATGCRNCRRRMGELRDGHAPPLINAAAKAAGLPLLVQPEALAMATPAPTPTTFDPTTLTDEQLAACVREARRRRKVLVDAFGEEA